ncbi:MAG: beta-N-acetylhexosaminidase [Tannerellaceae bacterium]|jgi:hexosaminidase|nr:beta-N-acetylhexosaminidase [Tannerellaceae bacterium]
MKPIILIGLCLFVQIQGFFAQNRDIYKPFLIPRPQQEKYSDGFLRLPANITISIDFDINAKELLGNILTGILNIKVTEVPNKDSFIRFFPDNSLDNEAYRIIIDTARINVYASDAQGCLWAVQTLHQMIKHIYFTYPGQDKQLPVTNIKDSPRYAWRGFHLDVARHFLTKEYLLKTIERLSFYKINKLNLHLSDDQGWRIEIDKYPLLTEVGAWRTFNNFDSICFREAKYNPDMEIDKRFIRKDSLYGGYYTKADMREIISHAKKYGIEIIPEIDMPGHMSAAIRAYPWLSCTGNQGWGNEFSYPVCPCNPKVIDFAKDVYAEIADLFPSGFIHIGADEVERDTWEINEDCKKLIKKNKMKSSEGLRTLFVEKINESLKVKGKKTIVWDDAAIENISNDIHVTFWREWMNENADIIVGKGHSMIFMPWTPFYLSDWPSFERWKELYEFDITKNFPNMTDEKIVGYQACVWTELIPNEIRLEELIHPNLQAYSEFIWSRERNWDDFLKRMRLHNRIMDKEGIRYHSYHY